MVINMIIYFNERGDNMQNFLVTWFPFILVIVVFYLMILLPENKRKKKYNEMLTSLKLNDEILTKGGILGKIVNLKDDYVILESGPDRARIKLDKNGISQVLTSKTEEPKVEKEAKEVKDTKKLKDAKEIKDEEK